MKINMSGSALLSSIAMCLCTASVANAGVIAWSTNVDTFYGNHSIYLMNDDGSNKRQLVSSGATAGLDNGDSRMPSISPDGTKIAFSRWVDNSHRYDVFVVNNDGTGLKRVTQNEDADLYPSWSPDGSKLVFASRADGAGQDIVIINADGTGQTALYQTTTAELQQPVWSPDGNKILFSAVSGTEHGNKSAIYAINANGTGLTALVDDYSYSSNPSWSLDGQHIVFDSYNSTVGARDLYKMNANGSGVTALTTTGDNSDPVFDGQGNVIFFSSRDGNYEIYSLSTNGSTVTRLTNTGGDFSGGGQDIEPAWGVAATISPNQAPVAVNDNYTFKLHSKFRSFYVSAPGVLSNDSDVDSTTLTAKLISRPKYGTLTFNVDGSFVYKASVAYAFSKNKVDTFTYLVSDGKLTSNVATVTISRKR